MVHELIRTTNKERKRKMKIKIDAIEMYSGTQVRQEIDESVVTDYVERMKEGDVFPPIVVFSDGNHHYLADGFHRVLASERNKFIAIDADVRKGTQQDALWYALGANRTNGKNMTDGDKRRAVALALKAWPDKTQQAIAEQVGCSEGLVNKVKKELILTHEDEDIPETRTNERGQERPTTYRKREQEQETETQQETMEEMPDETGEYEEQEQEEMQVEKTRHEKKTKPCLGLQYARIAIMNLEYIEKNDTEREEAFNKVERWINENR